MGLRLLHLISSPDFTGPAEAVLDICDHLRIMGHDVEVICESERSGDLRQMIVGQRLTSPLKLFLRNRPLPWQVWSDVRALRTHLQSGAYDLVHCHFSHDHAVAAWAVRALKRTALVRSSYHGRLTHQWLTPWLMRATRAMVFTSEADCREFLAGYPHMPTLVSPPALHFERWNSYGADLRHRLGLKPHHRVLAMVARFNAGRDQEALLEGFAAICGEFPDWRLVFFGRGERLSHVRAKAQTLQLQQQVLFGGYLTDDLAAGYRTSDWLYLGAPGHDGLGRAALEAMACGRAILTTAAAPISEFVGRHQTGWIMPACTAAHLRQALTLASVEYTHERGAAAQKAVLNHCSLQARATRYASFYEELLHA